MATPIIKIAGMIKPADQQQLVEQIKERMAKDGMLCMPSYCELVGVIQDDGTFVPYLPNATYVLPESKAAQING